MCCTKYTVQGVGLLERGIKKSQIVNVSVYFYLLHLKGDILSDISELRPKCHALGYQVHINTKTETGKGAKSCRLSS